MQYLLTGETRLSSSISGLWSKHHCRRTEPWQVPLQCGNCQPHLILGETGLKTSIALDFCFLAFSNAFHMQCSWCLKVWQSHMLGGKRFLRASCSECLFVRGSWGCSVSPRLGWGFVDHRGQHREWWPGQGAAISTHSQRAQQELSIDSQQVLHHQAHFCFSRCPTKPELQPKSQNAPYWHFLLQWKCSFVLKRSSRNGVIEFHI